MSQYETGKFPIITTKITYSNFTDVFADKFPLSSYRVVMLDALFSGIACGRNRIFFSQVDALFYVSDIPFHRDVYSEWHHTGCDRMHFRLSQYNLPSYLDGTEEARELNSKLIDEFFARFNGEELRNDLGPEYSDRESGVLLLFDIAKFKSKSDSGFIAARTFAHDAVKSGTILNFEDKDWFAKIKCHGKLGQTKVTFNMVLCVEERDSGMYR